MKRIYFAAAAAAILLLGACGGDDGDVLSAGGSDVELSSEEQAQADRIASAVLAEEDGDFGEITQEQADCVGRTAVSGLGVARATEIDWESDDPAFVPADAPVVADVLVTCLEMGPVLAESFSESGDITQEQADCISSELSDDELRSILEFSIAEPEGSPSADVAGPLADTVLECLDFGALLVEQFAASGGGISEESAQCLADALPDDLLRNAVLSGMMGVEDPAAENEFELAVIEATTDCLTPEELQALGG